MTALFCALAFAVVSAVTWAIHHRRRISGRRYRYSSIILTVGGIPFHGVKSIEYRDRD